MRILILNYSPLARRTALKFRCTSRIFLDSRSDIEHENRNEWQFQLA